MTDATISFNQPVYSVVEDDVILQIALNFSNMATFDVNVQITSIDDNGAIGTTNCFIVYSCNVLMWNIVGNVDYVSRPVNITFSAGETTVSFNISTIVDNTLEMNETYILEIYINPVSLMNSSVSITPSNASVIIIDDDRK